jgi:hypothetical protein
MCLCDLSMNTMYMILTSKLLTHQRAFNLHKEEEGVDVASSRAASDTPQKRDCHPSPEQVNSKTVGVPEALLSQFQCTQEQGRGELESS